MDRVRLLTWTTYGSWLPGDERGSVTTTASFGETRRRRNEPGDDYDDPMPGLHRASQAGLKGEPVRLTPSQAARVAEQLAETARFRGWSILALAVMANHVHVVVGVVRRPGSRRLVAKLQELRIAAIECRLRQTRFGTLVDRKRFEANRDGRRVGHESRRLRDESEISPDPFPTTTFRAHDAARRAWDVSPMRNCSRRLTESAAVAPASVGRQSHEELLTSVD